MATRIDWDHDSVDGRLSSNGVLLLWLARPGNYTRWQTPPARDHTAAKIVEEMKAHGLHYHTCIAIKCGISRLITTYRFAGERYRRYYGREPPASPRMTPEDGWERAEATWRVNTTHCPTISSASGPTSQARQIDHGARQELNGQLGGIVVLVRITEDPEEPRYIRAIRMAFKRPNCWEPWADTRIPVTRFVEYFRMSLEDFMWLSDELHQELQLDPLGRGQPLSVEAQVAVGLYRLAHGTSYLTIGHVCQIGKETADNATARFVRAVLKVLHTSAIGYPSLDRTDLWDDIAASFEERQGIPHVVGAIDGTHIPISLPPGDTWKGYINRKSWSSIVFQCVVDGEGNFRNVSGGGPGSMHDSRVFRWSRLGLGLLPGYAEPRKIPVNHFLIGDAGYPSTVDILVPYPSVVSPANEWFNFLQSSTRIVVEQAFGRLKNRFRILLHAQRARPIRARNTTFLCMILHNLLN
ncbi:hypothetical protein PSTT_04985 [Puccinia striiformis]|uniref:DDE Tnp4 domain-containing protein n=1 Tax=Puccinia striiformis TaxID=27350 RepID=A0A2S4VQU3_9BASI|nr:hypothetical protein PSTT_04985 [Puccinia striiformis]